MPFAGDIFPTFHSHTSVPWSPNVWGSHQPGVLQCTSILTIYLEVASDPKAKSSVPQNCTPSFHSPGLLADQIQTHNSLLRFTHFLEWLAELRKTVYLLDYQFITKGYNSGTERWKRCTGKDRRRGRNVHGLSEGAAFRTFMYSPTWKLPKPHIQEFWGRVIT